LGHLEDGRREQRHRPYATKTLEDVLHDVAGPAGWIIPLISFHFTLVQNIRRDPFEQTVGIDQKTAMGMGGALAAPATAFQYDWNMLPIGQQLWMEWFETLKAFPPMQAPASYNLTQVMDQIKAGSGHASE